MALRPPPRRPASQVSALRPGMLAVPGIPTQPAAEDVAADTRQLLQQQFQDVLQEDLGLDRETLELLKVQFGHALEEVQAQQDAHPGIPDRAQWMDAMQALQASGQVSESEVNDLIRQINQALQPLQRRESQLAIEFSRRIGTDGQEKALEWFRQESARAQSSEAEPAASAEAPADVSPLLRSDVVNSRSRRLRGPPR